MSNNAEVIIDNIPITEEEVQAILEACINYHTQLHKNMSAHNKMVNLKSMINVLSHGGIH